MNNLPYMPWFPADYQRDTAHLDEGEDLLYRRLLDYYWQSKSDVDFEPERLARAVRMSRRLFEKRWKTVSTYFFVENGKLHNERARQEWQLACEIVEKRRVAGKKGGKASGYARRNKSDVEANVEANVQQALKQTSSKRCTDAERPILRISSDPPDGGSPPLPPKGGESKRAPAVRHDQRFDEWYQAYPKNADKKPAREVWKRKRLDARADELIADVKRREAEHGPWQDKQFIRSPARYLRDESWQDEITPITTTPKALNGQGSPRLSRFEQAMANANASNTEPQPGDSPHGRTIEQ